MSVWIVKRDTTPGWDWEDTPPVILENRIASTARLERGGVHLENRVYNPVYREGEQYQTTAGSDLTARIRIEQAVVQDDGSTTTVTREAVDTGRAAPQFVQTTDTGITDEERAMGDAIRAEYNQQVFEQNLWNNYTEPYQAPIESAPDSGYGAYDPGYVESSPIAVPQDVYTPPAYYEPDQQTVQYNPYSAGNAAANGVVNIGGWVQDIIIPEEPQQQSDPWADYIAYQNALEQAESEGAYGWGGPLV
jgi:hypothetical protein